MKKKETRSSEDQFFRIWAREKLSPRNPGMRRSQAVKRNDLLPAPIIKQESFMCLISKHLS